jgi:O-antigen/teichoic acid export membrane protein
MLKYAYPLMIAAVSSVLLTVADRYTVRFYAGIESMGIYSLGFKVANVLKIVFINSALSAILPLKFMMMDKPDSKRFYSKTMNYFAFSFAILLMGLSFFGKEAIVVLARDTAYWDAYKIIPLLCFAQFFELLRRNVNFGLIIQKKTNIISIITLVFSVLNVLFNILLITFFGIIGSAIAVLFIQLIFFITTYLYAQKHFFIPYEIGNIIKILLVTAGLTIIAYLFNPIHILPRIIIKLFLFASFPFILYFLKFYEEIELKTLKNGWNKWKNLKNLRSNLSRIKIK